MDIGVDQYSLNHLHQLPGTDGYTLLNEAKRFGLAGVQFSSVRQLSPTFDLSELRAMRDYAITERLYIEGGIVVFAEVGLAFNPRALGDGIVPLPEIIRELARFNPNVKLSIEDHGRLFSIPIFRDEYLATFAELPGAVELAHVVRYAHQCEQRISEGTLPSTDEIEAIPWADRVDDRVMRGAAYLRGVVQEVMASADTSA